MLTAAESFVALERLLPQPSGLAVFCGDDFAHALVMMLAVAGAGNRRMVVLDGGNVFDVYLLSDAARTSGTDPQALLTRVLVSRAFTCHQLARLATEGLPDAVQRYRPAAVVGLGLDATFYDEQVPYREAARLWGRMRDAVAQVAQTHPVLLSLGPVAVRSRAGLVSDLWQAAGWRFRLVRAATGVLITRAHPEPGQWLWSTPLKGGTTRRDRAQVLRQQMAGK